MKFTQFGKYTIMKKLATGGMAEIFLATDIGPTGVGRFVVIKRALSQFSDNEEFKDMFKNEGKVACNLKHRNIAPIYEFGIEASQLFLSMEYVAGCNLRELIKKVESLKKKIAVENAVYIIKEAASGLNYAHNAIDSSAGKPLGLIHRDVSPQNIMLSFDGEIKLIDFGISKVADTDLTRAGHLKGKFSYMSPEQAQAEPLDHRTDIFCLGVILWEMLAGERLFSFKSEMNALKKIKACHIPNVQEKSPRVPSELAKIVHRALQKNKNARYETAAKMERDLNVFLNKNYPEFSQYDFISFIKKIYSREILREREKQKLYSKEFKKYISSLSENSNFYHTDSEISPENNLDLPSIDSVSESGGRAGGAAPGAGGGATKTQTAGQREHSMSLSRSRYENQTKTSETEASRTYLMPEEQSLSGSHEPQTLSKTRAAGKMSREDSGVTSSAEEFFQKSSAMKERPGLPRAPAAAPRAGAGAAYDYKAGSLRAEEKKQRLLQAAALALTVIIALGAFLVFKRRESLMRSDLAGKIFSTVKNTSAGRGEAQKPPSPESSFQAEKPGGKPAGESLAPGSGFDAPSPPKRTVSSAHRRILLRTKPSGAMIFVNGKFLSYTPSALAILPDREIQITIRKHGYKPRTLAAREIQQSNLYITLNRKRPRR